VKRDIARIRDPWSTPPEETDEISASEVDRAQREAVVAYEASHGRKATMLPFSQPGYDIESVDDQGRIRRIEVKGLKGEWSETASVILTRRQVADALANGNIMISHWLYIVDDLGGKQEVHPLPWTAQSLAFGFYASHWRALAEQARALDELTSP